MEVMSWGQGISFPNENSQRTPFILQESVYLSQSGLVMDKYAPGKCLDGPLKMSQNFLGNFFKAYLKQTRHTIVCSSHLCQH